MARRATRSVRRGIGPPCGAAPLDLHTFPAQLVDNPAAKFTPPDDPGLPINILALVIMASLFMLREIEVAALRVKDVVVNTASCTVTLFLAVSKTDPTARGCYRSWGCLCGHDGATPCAFHAALGHLDSLTKLFGKLVGDMPFFPTVLGETVLKAAVVRAVKWAAAVTGQAAEANNHQYTGHSFRVSGAQFLAAIGVDLTLIQLMARWESSVIARYVRESPLVTLTRLTKMALARRTDEGHSSAMQAGRTLTEKSISAFLKKWEAKLQTLAENGSHLRAVGVPDAHHEDLDAVERTTRRPQLDARRLTAVVNATNNKAHILDPDVARGARADFKTRCGWSYPEAITRLTKAMDVVDGPRCTRCWRRVLVRGAEISSGSESA